MKIYFKSSGRIKGKVPAESVLPSKTCTYNFPDDAATVVITNATKAKPSFKIYFYGDKSVPTSYGYNTHAHKTVAEQIHINGKYQTHFGQNSWLPTDKIPEMIEMINKIEQIINS